MYLFREVVRCRPGKVREMVNKFKGVSGVMQRMGYPPFRIYTDVSAERFWTVILEAEAESLSAFMEMEESVMADEEARSAMAGYHDLVLEGRREIFRIEA